MLLGLAVRRVILLKAKDSERVLFGIGYGHNDGFRSLEGGRIGDIIEQGVLADGLGVTHC